MGIENRKQRERIASWDPEYDGLLDPGYKLVELDNREVQSGESLSYHQVQ